MSEKKHESNSWLDALRQALCAVEMIRFHPLAHTDRELTIEARKLAMIIRDRIADIKEKERAL